MDTSTEKAQLKKYLQDARAALLWKLEGLSDYDMRRPMVPTGTNLLGLVKHMAAMDGIYFGEVFDRPFPGGFPSLADDAPTNADLYATADESSASVIELYRAVWAHSDLTIDELDLDAPGVVSWWLPATRTSLHRILVHVIAETNRHAGHADIVRELIDGEVGHRASYSNLPEGDAAWWREYRDQVEAIALGFEES